MNTKLLRQKILDLAIRGKLTEQKKSDGTTKDLLKQIQDERTGEALQTRDERKSESSACHPEQAKRVEGSSIVKREYETYSPNVILSNASSCHSERSAKGAKSKNLAKEIIPLDKSEAPFEIPENWEWVRLGDVCELISGQDFPPEKYNAEGKGLPYITGASNFSDSHVILNRWTEFPSVIAYKGDILLVCKGSGYGNYIYADFDEAHIARQIMAIRIQNEILKSYIFYFIGSQYDYLKTKGNGLVPGIARNVVLELEIPLPPLAEQQRIVEAIENAFAEITTIENNQELLKKHIKQGRQKILDLAIRGKLTEQKKSDGTTKDLLKQIQDERTGEALQTRDERTGESSTCHPEQAKRVEGSSIVKREYAKSKNLGTSKKDVVKEIIPLDKSEAPFEIPSTWEWVKLGDICDKLIDGDHNPPKGIDEQTEYLMLSSRNINGDRIVDLENVRYLPKEVFEEEDKRTNLAEGDILFTSVGSLGRSCVYNGNGKFCFQRSVTVVHTRILNYYLKYFFDSEYYQKVILENATGTAQLGFYLEQMRKSLIALPPLAEQQRIVAAIQESFAEFDAMEKEM